MNKQLFDYLLNQFEPSYCLSNYIAWKKGQTKDVSPDGLYSVRCEIKNQLVQKAFIRGGNEGIRYLIAMINKGDEDESGRAVTLIGEIGDNFPNFNLQKVLSKRLSREPTTWDFTRRIEHSIEELVRKTSERLSPLPSNE